MSSVCPACGVAVVPGYIRCPKCRAALSLAGATTGRIPRMDPGGTALPDRRFPYAAVGGGVAILVAMIVVFGFRGGGKKTEAAAAVVAPAVIAAEPIAEAPRQSFERNVAAARAAQAAAQATASAPDPREATRDLEAVLRQQRLWGRVEVVGARVDVRSGSCADRAMRPAIDGKAVMLRDAGLTKLRCLEQSGAVVFERDL